MIDPATLAAALAAHALWLADPASGARANRTGADLTGANLTGADLTDAEMYRAYLEDADLTGADLTGANLTGVIWLNTTCPNGVVQSTQCPRTAAG